jgi:hypothetical protein
MFAAFRRVDNSSCAQAILFYNAGEKSTRCYEWAMIGRAPGARKDYLDQHGKGIHHVAFFVPKTEVAASSFVEHGYTITQQGLFTGQAGMYLYLASETQPGTTLELLADFGT